MTDKEIIKALECCFDNKEGCDKCPIEDECILHQPQPILLNHTLDLINRQQAEIKELEAEIDKQYEQAEADILGNIPHGGASCHWCIDGHRKDAIKEFAERLKSRLITVTYMNFDDTIDNLVKEMVGEG